MINSASIAVPATGNVTVVDMNQEPPIANLPPGQELPIAEGGTLLLRVPNNALADVLVGGPNEAPSLLLRAADTQPTLLTVGPNDVLVAKSNTNGTASTIQVLIASH